MAKFREVPRKFIKSKLIEFSFNMFRNYTENVQDEDFFDIINWNIEQDEAVDIIKSVYTEQELEEMQNATSRCVRLDFDYSLNLIFRILWNHEDTRDKCKSVLEKIRNLLLPQGGETMDGEIVAKRFAEIKRLLRLSDLENDILVLSYVIAQTNFAWPRHVSDSYKPLFYAMAIDRSLAEVENVMTGKGKLRKFDLLEEDWDFNRHTIGCFINGTDSEALERRFYRKSEEQDLLPWNFFGDIATGEGEVVKQMIGSSHGKCNILLYGVPGTGKTSFARSLARELGRTLFEIMQGDNDGRNMKAETRLAGIQICNDHEETDSSMMVIDEADELLRGNSCGFPGMFFAGIGGKTTEKGITNTILDEMKMPAIWISNAPAEAMDESVRRRFAYSICFERMNHAQRVNIWKNLIKKFGLGDLIPEDKVPNLAAEYETSAGGISIVLESVKNMAPDAGHVESLIAKLMKPHCKLMGIEKKNGFLPAKDYSLDGLNIKGKVGLGKIVRAVRNYLDDDFGAAAADKPRMNILMFGPPGTGKTEFVKYLGAELDRKVIAVSGSDILSMFVGGTEKNIAAAFRNAESEHAVLFFDEIDGLVQSRENAMRSWEVSQVNELLQQMEKFNGVMIAATNFCKNLDPAIMRRFTFKLEFDYLDDAGKKTFFERFFKSKLTDVEFAALKKLRNLAPGDFRTVRQNRFYLADSQSNMDLIDALGEECAMKKDGDLRPCIGF